MVGVLFWAATCDTPERFCGTEAGAGHLVVFLVEAGAVLLVVLSVLLLAVLLVEA
jgi:hypothetical protein